MEHVAPLNLLLKKVEDALREIMGKDIMNEICVSCAALVVLIDWR
jgi:hypothetical protein